jgi:hypothetical protein
LEEGRFCAKFSLLAGTDLVKDAKEICSIEGPQEHSGLHHSEMVQHPTNQAFMVEWPEGRHSSVKGTSQAAWSLPKGT